MININTDCKVTVTNISTLEGLSTITNLLIKNKVIPFTVNEDIGKITGIKTVKGAETQRLIMNTYSKKYSIEFNTNNLEVINKIKKLGI